METLLGISFFIIIVSIALAILLAYSKYKLFEKAGEEGWKAIIPFYSFFITTRIAFNGTMDWLFLAILAPMAVPFMSGSIASSVSFIASIAVIYVSFSFARRFAGVGLSILSILFPIVGLPIIAFNSRYVYEPYQWFSKNSL